MSEHHGPRVWPLRVIALTIALSIWLGASFVPRVQSLMADRVDWPIETELSYSTPEGSDLMVISPTQTVRLRLRGTENQRRETSTEDVVMTVALDQAFTPGEPTEVLLSREQVSLPEDLEVLSIEPNTIDLMVDREITQLVLIVPYFVGEYPAGVQQESWSIQPREAELRGPASLLDRFNSIETSPIDRTERYVSIEDNYPLPTPDNPLVTLVRPRTVKVTVNLSAPELSGVSGTPNP